MDVHWEMAAATFHCCSCGPGCCSCSRVSWQISGCKTQESSKSCRTAAPGQAEGLLLESLLGICSPCCVLTGLKVLGKQCSTLYKKFLMLKALSPLPVNISHAETVNVWNNENFGGLQLPGGQVLFRSVRQQHSPVPREG